MRYAVFGLGDSSYERNFNTVAGDVDSWLAQLYGVQVAPLGAGDTNTANSLHKGQRADFDAWMASALPTIQDVLAHPERYLAKPMAPEMPEESDSDPESDGGGNGGGEGDMVDLEDLGAMVGKISKAKKQRQGEDQLAPSERREMVTPELRKELTKQGYSLIGSHSGVKICRWTKSMLRGRGGCYKHTFYGIESHRCMETTPSLACANKCIFYWRHHTNPVGTSWRWKMDEPELIVDGAMQNHYEMIKSYKGVPGVIPHRFTEANHIKHCALSLVGEPIMYPEINRFLEILHARKISTFLVTNAQFPECIDNLTPVCQLYVSIDASTESSLKAIDRPLFKDFWPRFLTCLDSLGKKGQRTVYRLTIVKQWNDDEAINYARLVARGNPDFIEVKGVTFCGESKASSLSMKNVPWHEEVISFVKRLADLLPGYELCSEHEHSNSLLIASTKFRIDGHWHTWIDYDKFHELVGSGKPFTSMDYISRTPDWAVIDSVERGFDPVEVRHHRKKASKNVFGC